MFEFCRSAGFIPKEEAEIARKIMPLMMKGEMPGLACKSKDQCESYCENESRAEECASFAILRPVYEPGRIRNI